MTGIPVVRVCPLCRQPHGADVTCRELRKQAREMLEAARALANKPDGQMILSRLRLREMLKRRAAREQRER